MNTGTPASGLRRELASRHVQMIAIGGAIGTGLFLGSGLALSLAGPAVVVLFGVAALLALVLAYALAELVVAHPEAVGFGGITQRYLGSGAGFVQRWSYLAAQVTNIGSEVVAAGIYVRFWWPEVPLWLPVVVFSVALLAINATAVRWFGETEYWFAMIKVVTIVVFILLGLLYVFYGLPGNPAVGLRNWTGNGGFAPNGIEGIWLAMAVVTFSYLGSEVVAVTAAESKDPETAVPRATRTMILRLAVFYVLGMAVVVSVVPWQQAAATEGITQSPFVRLFEVVGIPGAASVMNFVVLTAALSAMNTNLYVSSRMVYSLSLDRLAPRSLGRISARGVPVRALGLSALGLAIAAVLASVSPADAFPVLLGLALFGALVTWLLIFASHIAYRRRPAADARPTAVRLRGAPWTTLLAMLVTLGVIVTTAFTEQFALAPLAGVPFVLLLVVIYVLINRRARTG